jgi:hypothetical protein
MPYRMNSKPLKQRWGVTKKKRVFVFLFRWFMLKIGYWFATWMSKEAYVKHFRPFLQSRVRQLDRRLDLILKGSKVTQIRPSLRERDYLTSVDNRVAPNRSEEPIRSEAYVTRMIVVRILAKDELPSMLKW